MMRIWTRVGTRMRGCEISDWKIGTKKGVGYKGRSESGRRMGWFSRVQCGREMFVSKYPARKYQRPIIPRMLNL